MSISRRGFIAGLLLLPLSTVLAKVALPASSMETEIEPIENLTYWPAANANEALAKQRLFETFRHPAKPGEFTSYDFIVYQDEHAAAHDIRSGQEYCVENVEEAYAMLMNDFPDGRLVSTTRFRWNQDPTKVFHYG